MATWSDSHSPREASLIPSPPELAGFRELLQSLGAEFERVESWASDIYLENCRFREKADQADQAAPKEINCHPDASIAKVPNDPLPVWNCASTDAMSHDQADRAFNESVSHSDRSIGQFQSDPSKVVDLDDALMKFKIDSEKDLSGTGVIDYALSLDRDETGALHTVSATTNGSADSDESNVMVRFESEIGGIQFEEKKIPVRLHPEDEEHMVHELRMWFQKLTAKDRSHDRNYSLSSLSPKYIQKLFVDIDGDFTRDEGWISEALLCFNKAVRKVIRQSEDIASSSLTKPFGKMISTTSKDPVLSQSTLGFDAFVQLIIWDNVEEHLNYRGMHDVLLIREVLIRQSIDELIFQFSGLSPAAKSPPAPLWRRIIEPTVGFVVLLNSLTIGISADHPSQLWEHLEVVYTCFFLFEIMVKTYAGGCKNHLFGPEWMWNWFDAFIVSLAVFDLALTSIATADSELGNLTMMRLARLAKLTRLLRLIRVVRLKAFKELLLLVKGVVAGMRTLAWAFVLLATLVYIVGVMLRQTVGERRIQMDDEYKTVLFHSVPWSMFNVFRCFTDDCTLPDGTPILSHLYELYGYSFVIPWAVVTLFVTFGVFNLIMAVFVENVQENAKQKRQLTRDDERARVVQQMRELVLMFCGTKKIDTSLDSNELSFFGRHSFNALSGHSTPRAYAVPTATEVHFQFGGIITREMFNKVINEPRMHDILDDLEVHVTDRSELFDLLDADRSNSVDVSELVHGILKLRSGGADKSDIVATILGIRAIQTQLSMFIDSAFENQVALRNELKEQLKQLEATRTEIRHDVQDELQRYSQRQSSSRGSQML